MGITEKEYRRLWRKLRDQYEERLKALNLVWEMSCDCKPPQMADGGDDSEDNQAEDPADHSIRGQVIAAVAVAVDELPEEFTTTDVEKMVRASRPDLAAERSTISHAVKRIAAARSLAIAEAGKGKRATRFRKAAQEAVAKFGCTSHGATPGQRRPDQVARFNRIQEVRRLVQESGMDVAQFRKEYLERYQAEKLDDLPSEAIETIASRLQALRPIRLPK